MRKTRQRLVGLSCICLTVLVCHCGRTKPAHSETEGQAPILAMRHGHVILYQECGYKGKGIELIEGEYNLSDLMVRGLKDNELSSIKIEPGYQVVCYDEVNFGGQSHILQCDEECLNAMHWNDKTSSLKVSKIQQEFFSYSRGN